MELETTNSATNCESPWVLLPGFMLDETLWDEVVSLCGHRRQIVRPRLATVETIEDIADDVARRAPDRFVLVGFSLGGYVARKLAERYPERVEALVLIASSLRDDTPEQAQAKRNAVATLTADSFQGLSRSSIARSVHQNRRGDDALIERIRSMGRRLGYAALASQSNLSRTINSQPALECPTLVIAAAADDLRSASETTELSAAIPGSTLVTIPDSGHMLPIEQPVALVEAIEDWLCNRKNGV
ncbi:Putative hydrolase or acyltransferase of alpha/beta superfamily [Paraburkholderia tropica]|uniref:alpha/beta fold hydrolase n=1 Tax=Paraburkholderia tropica TaxID=92647 RepID=UPI001CACC716|nr:alpha/beta hydrolase [Paraburkholderia tropica]CAG9208799.1 Putative hydrolase or acyltransferase of alpha/beta superfamily [Paraburkholderia tropica]